MFTVQYYSKDDMPWRERSQTTYGAAYNIISTAFRKFYWVSIYSRFHYQRRMIEKLAEWKDEQKGWQGAWDRGLKGRYKKKTGARGMNGIW